MHLRWFKFKLAMERGMSTETSDPASIDNAASALSAASEEAFKRVAMLWLVTRRQVSWDVRERRMYDV